MFEGCSKSDGEVLFDSNIPVQLNWQSGGFMLRLAPDQCEVLGSTPSAGTKWFHSSVGQNSRLITGLSKVRVLVEPPIMMVQLSWQSTCLLSRESASSSLPTITNMASQLSRQSDRLLICRSQVRALQRPPNMVIWCNWKAYSPAKATIQVQDLLLPPTPFD